MFQTAQEACQGWSALNTGSPRAPLRCRTHLRDADSRFREAVTEQGVFPSLSCFRKQLLKGASAWPVPPHCSYGLKMRKQKTCPGNQREVPICDGDWNSSSCGRGQRPQGLNEGERRSLWLEILQPPRSMYQELLAGQKPLLFPLCSLSAPPEVSGLPEMNPRSVCLGTRARSGLRRRVDDGLLWWCRQHSLCFLVHL